MAVANRHTEEEKARLEEAARLVLAGRPIREVARELAAELGRSEQGVVLILGRTVARLSGRGGRRRALRALAPPTGGRGRSLQRLVAEARATASKLSSLRRQRERLDTQIAVKEERLRSLRDEIVRRIGLDAVPAAE